MSAFVLLALKELIARMVTLTWFAFLVWNDLICIFEKLPFFRWWWKFPQIIRHDSSFNIYINTSHGGKRVAYCVHRVFSCIASIKFSYLIMFFPRSCFSWLTLHIIVVFCSGHSWLCWLIFRSTANKYHNINYNAYLSNSISETEILGCSSSPCQNGATCFDHNGSGGYVCICATGFEGTNCESGNILFHFPKDCLFDSVFFFCHLYLYGVK